MTAESDTTKLHRRNRELSILNTIAQALNRSVDLDQALHVALALVAELLDLQTGWVWLLDEETAESYLAAAQNLPPGLANNPQAMEGSCYCLHTFKAGDMDGAANVNIIECSRLYDLVEGTEGLLYHASIPLYAHSKKLGMLNVASTDWRGLSHDDLQLLYTVGDLLGIAVERARLFHKSTQLGALEERNRLAREIHDTLAQGLTAVSLQLESADALLEAGVPPAKTRRAVQQALALTRANLEEVRRSVLDLRAAPLEGRALPEALELLANQCGLNVKMVIVGGKRPFSPRIETALYRIAQEALTNINKHAAASQVVLQLIASPTELQLIIEDNGTGFEPEQVVPGRYGLVGINERVRLLGGTFHLQSSPGNGTRLEVHLPLEGGYSNRVKM